MREVALDSFFNALETFFNESLVYYYRFYDRSWEGLISMG